MTAEIKNAPARIYLNLGPVPSEEIEFSALHEVTWCADKQNASDIEYVLATSDAAQAPASLIDRLKYFLSAWGMNGVGSTVAKIQDSPDTAATLTVNDLSALLSVIEPDAPVAPAAAPPIALLAADHTGMRVDYSGVFKHATTALARGGKEPGLAEMLRQLQEHIAELGQRWYAGDTAVVDELLQLYCVEKDARDALVAASGAAK